MTGIIIFVSLVAACVYGAYHKVKDGHQGPDY